MTNNELIAEFVGFSSIGFTPIEKQSIYKILDSKGNPIHPYYGPYRSEQMQFNRSWDWLMPAWFKFQNDCKNLLQKLELTEYHYYEKYFLLGIKQQDINISYKALVDGIKWYNTRNT